MAGSAIDCTTLPSVAGAREISSSQMGRLPAYPEVPRAYPVRDGPYRKPTRLPGVNGTAAAGVGVAVVDAVAVAVAVAPYTPVVPNTTLSIFSVPVATVGAGEANSFTHRFATLSAALGRVITPVVLSPVAMLNTFVVNEVAPPPGPIVLVCVKVPELPVVEYATANDPDPPVPPPPTPVLDPRMYAEKVTPVYPVLEKHQMMAALAALQP